MASLFSLNRSPEALPLIRETLKLAAQAGASGKRPDPKLVPAMVDYLQRFARERRNPVIMSEAADWWEKMSRTDAGSLYDSSCYRFLTADFLEDKTAAKVEADKAMAWLTKAVVAGWKDREHIDQDTDLDALRDRPDFKELVGSLPYLAPPPRAVR